jgi:hypothetical protein
VQITSSPVTPQFRSGRLDITPRTLVFKADGNNTAFISNGFAQPKTELALPGLNDRILAQAGPNPNNVSFTNILTGQDTGKSFTFAQTILLPIENKHLLAEKWYEEVRRRAMYLNSETHGIDKGYKKAFPFWKQPLTAFTRIPHKPVAVSN